MTDFPIDTVRDQFPSLGLKDDGRARIYFDNPAGTQVPQHVIDRVVQAMVEQNANLGGYFTTSRKAQELVDQAHVAAAQFYNASSASEIVFGANMTTLTFAMARSLQRTLNIGEGDEIVVSRMDHDGNVAPWMHMATDTGATLKWLDFDPETYEFADDAIDKVLTRKTRIVAVGYASNITGTVNDVKSICAKARVAGALTYVDAVQFAPHGVIDVQDIGCDFLVSSAYKFFGPHAGVLYGRKHQLERTYSYNVRPALENLGGGRFATGTAARETLAGTLGAIEYISSLANGRDDNFPVSRTRITAGMQASAEHESRLCKRLLAGLASLKGVKVRGITSENSLYRRVPTVSITVDGKKPEQLAKALADDNIFVWSGHSYALEPIARMGLTSKGGVLRIGLAHYNTMDEVDTILNRLEDLV
jgi:cysteine desulfurase family protein (TIGR01976 family)